MSHRDRLAEQLAQIPPTDLERDPVGVVMCGLMADLLDALTGGAEQDKADDGQDRAGHVAGPAPAATTDEGQEGDAAVQLLEPDVPPTDGTDPGGDARERAVAEQAAAGTRSGRPPARKAAAKKAAPKKAAAAAAAETKGG